MFLEFWFDFIVHFFPLCDKLSLEFIFSENPDFFLQLALRRR